MRQTEVRETGFTGKNGTSRVSVTTLTVQKGKPPFTRPGRRRHCITGTRVGVRVTST